MEIRQFQSSPVGKLAPFQSNKNATNTARSQGSETPNEMRGTSSRTELFAEEY